MTLTTHGNDQIIEQIIKQLRKLVKVVKVTDLTERSHVEREMVMLTVNAEMGVNRAGSDQSGQCLSREDRRRPRPMPSSWK
jgi:acetolactate synthase small subunit